MKSIVAILITLASTPAWATDYCYKESLAAGLANVVNGSPLETLANGSFNIVSAVQSSIPGFDYAITVKATLRDLNGNVYNTISKTVDVRVDNVALCSTTVQRAPRIE